MIARFGFHASRAAGACLLGSLALLAACRSATPHDGAERGKRFERGIASWYGPGFQGKTTANGERFDTRELTAAHKKLPFDTVVEVVNLENGRSVRVRINDRGPFIRGRVIDLSKAAAERIDMVRAGTAPVALYLVEGLQPASVSPGPWTVQVAAFRDMQRASQLAAELTPRFPSTVVRSDAVWHRVQVGDYDRREQARKVARRLEQQGHQALVVRADGRR